MYLTKALQNSLDELKQGFGVVIDNTEYALFKDRRIYGVKWKTVIMSTADAQATRPEFDKFEGIVDDADQVHTMSNYSVDNVFVNRVPRGDFRKDVER